MIRISPSTDSHPLRQEVERPEPVKTGGGSADGGGHIMGRGGMW